MARTAPQVAGAFAQRVDAVLDLADLGEQGVRVVGRDEAPGRAFEQREAEDRFGVAQRLRHRRLRNIERAGRGADRRSEEHTSELQSLMRISYAVVCLNKKNTTHTIIYTT